MLKMNCVSKYTFTLISELAYYEERVDMGASQGLSARQIQDTWKWHKLADSEWSRKEGTATIKGMSKRCLIVDKLILRH